MWVNPLNCIVHVALGHPRGQPRQLSPQGHFWTHVDLQVLLWCAFTQDRKCFVEQVGGHVKWAGAMPTDNPEGRAHPQGQPLQSNRKLSLSLQDQLSSSSEQLHSTTASPGLFPLLVAIPAHLYTTPGGCPQQRAPPIATFFFPSHFKSFGLSASKVTADRLFSILQLAQMACHVLEMSLKHKIKTLLLSLPQHP